MNSDQPPAAPDDPCDRTGHYHLVTRTGEPVGRCVTCGKPAPDPAAPQPTDA